MNIIEIIDKKRLGKTLTLDELKYSFNGYMKNIIKDYQMSSLLMAILLNGMSDDEIINLTEIFIKSGKTLSFKPKTQIVDKHSTGGIGDKITMIIGPLVSSCDVYFPKMSGKGLGITGGTIDKLESIPGLKTNLKINNFIKQVRDIKFAVASQTENLVYLDKLVYDLRNATATTDSIPLIAVSIMSKKIACGAENILIDIKCGKGALIKNKKDANELSRIMIKIGTYFNCNVKTIISDMNNPLGYNIGNALEVIEAVDVLKGKKGNLTDLCIIEASTLVSMAKNISLEAAKKEVIEKLNSGEAYKQFKKFIKYQKGDLTKLRVSSFKVPIYSEKTGIIKSIDAYQLGKIAFDMGCGRKNKTDKIDYGVGIVLAHQLGEVIKTKELLCTLYVKNNLYRVDYNEVIKAFKIV